MSSRKERSADVTKPQTPNEHAGPDRVDHLPADDSPRAPHLSEEPQAAQAAALKRESPEPTPGSGTRSALRAGDSKRSMRRRFIELGESWGGSFVLHGAVLVILALLTLSGPRPQEQPLLNVIQRPPEELNQRLDEQIDPATSLNLVTTRSASQTHGDPLESSLEPQLDRELNETVEAPQIDLADVFLRALPGERLGASLGIESPGDPSAAVADYSAAMDRITQEIVLMLAKSKTLIVWLFDQSPSMRNDQQEIKERIERVYSELGLTSAADGDALWTAVASFGQATIIHTRRPTGELDEIRAAIDEIPEDESGQEAMCQAVIEVVQAHRRYAVQGDRQLAVIVVSDESGDDGNRIEATIDAARDARCRLYVLGREAVFGYRYAHIKWTWINEDDSADTINFWLPIRRGPETPFVEQLQTNAYWRRYDAHPSGFGSYEQVRLARQTGGVFFMLPSLESDLVHGEKRIYEIDAMRPYLPDLSSREEYAAARQQNDLKRGLWEIIGTLNPYQEPRVNLRQDFVIDPAGFVRQVREEQQKARDLIAVYQAAEQRLDELEEARQQETSPRWQANYDLLYAQVVAYQLRVYEYGAYLEAFLANPRPVQKLRTTHWRIRNRKKTITGETNSDIIYRAETMLKAVQSEHPGTPYAARAQWELNRGLGAELVEWFEDPRRGSIKKPNF